MNESCSLCLGERIIVDKRWGKLRTCIFRSCIFPQLKTDISIALDAVGLAQRLGTQAVSFGVVDELHLVGVQIYLTIQE